METYGGFSPSHKITDVQPVQGKLRICFFLLSIEVLHWVSVSSACVVPKRGLEKQLSSLSAAVCLLPWEEVVVHWASGREKWLLCPLLGPDISLGDVWVMRAFNVLHTLFWSVPHSFLDTTPFYISTVLAKPCYWQGNGRAGGGCHVDFCVRTQGPLLKLAPFACILCSPKNQCF